MNTGESWPSLDEARVRVLSMQTKLHQWSSDDSGRRFDDLFNLVADPAFLTVAWDRVRGNRGARSAGVDGIVPRSVVFGVAMLHGLRAQLKTRSFVPLPVKERLIPKTSGKFRRLGIPAVRDRIVQASLKLVLEPIFEADFHPCSYGFRPRRRPHDAIAEIHMLASNQYLWVLEGDIEACFDEISHPALMDRIRKRIGDKRVVALIKAFLCAGVLSEDGVTRDTKMGTPQGGILSPLLANIALSVLDDHFAEAWERDMATRTQRATRRSHGHATYRLVRYADDFVVMVAGTEAHAEGLLDEVATVLAPMGLRLSDPKTLTAHIDDGFEFLGAYPASSPAGLEQTIRLHLALQEVPGFDPGQSEGDHENGDEPALVRNAPPDQPDPAGLDQLFPARRVKSDIQSRPPVHLATDRALAPTKTPTCHMAVVETSLPGQQLVARTRRGSALQLRQGTDHSLPIPRNEDSDTLGTDQHRRLTGGTGPWRAGCGGSRTSGSGDGPEKPTSRNAGRALRADLTSPTRSSMSAAAGCRTRPWGTGAVRPIRCIGLDGC